MENSHQFPEETGSKRIRVGTTINIVSSNAPLDNSTLTSNQNSIMSLNSSIPRYPISHSNDSSLSNPTKSSNYRPLLPPMLPCDEGKHTLVLDMDGTLLADNTGRWSKCIVDFVLRQKLTGARTFVSKRPGLEQFLSLTENLFEIVVFTDSSRKRADVILETLVNSKCIRHRLYRDSCTEVYGKLVKDLSRLGRDLSKVIVIDDCPFSYMLQQSNAIPIAFFGGHKRDRELKDVYNFLKNMNKKVDVRIALLEGEFHNENPPDSADDEGNPIRSNGEALLITPENALTAPNVMGPLLPPMNSWDEGKHTLVLDMDGTLVSELDEKIPNCPPDFITPARGPERPATHVYKRPGLEEFLATMENLFEIVIFTASLDWRAKMFLGHFENKSCIRFQLFRDSCIMLQGRSIIKDLSRLGRDVRKVIIIDDQPRVYELQQFNGIPIKPFDGDLSDRELIELIPFLEQLSEQEDVRPLIQSRYDSEVFVEETQDGDDAEAHEDVDEEEEEEEEEMVL